MKNLIYSGKKKFLFLAVILMAMTTSCRDDFGTQCFKNKTSEPVDIFIDGYYEFTLDERGKECIFLGTGCFDWYAEGVLSGFYSEGSICLSNDSFETTIVIDD